MASIAMLVYQRVRHLESGISSRGDRASDQVDVNGLVAVEATDSGSGKGALNQLTAGRRCFKIYHLVIQHSHGIDGPFIDGLPIKNGDFPWLC